MVLACEEMTDFSYETAHDAAGLPARITIFADNPRTRREVADDLAGAGFRAQAGGDVCALIDGPIAQLGDVVMIDCISHGEDGLEAETLAALTRLDMRIARSGAHLIVCTSLNALDDVFASLDQSQAQILVQPTRAERIVAVGRVMANVSNSRVREMSEEDRLSLLHLSQQVEAIAHKLEGLSAHRQVATNLESTPKEAAHNPVLPNSAPSGVAQLHSAGAGLPDPRLIRQMISARQARARFFDGELFADPAWDMLLDLTAAHAEKARVSVTSLCIAAAVPATTALRWLKQMVDSGVFVRVADKSDRRRAFIELSDSSIDAMARYFEAVETPLARAA